MMKTVLRLFLAIARYIVPGQCGPVAYERVAAQNCTRGGSAMAAGSVTSKKSRSLKPRPRTNSVVREHLDLGVQLAHAAVVEPARRLDLVFGVDELGLQLQEVLARLQLGVRLGDGEDRLQRLLHVVLGRARLGRALRRQRLGAGLGDVLEDRLLVRRVALDRLDEVRDQVGTTLELHRDVAPRLVDAHVQRDQRVVRGPQVDADDQHECDDDEDGDEPFHGTDS